MNFTYDLYVRMSTTDPIPGAIELQVPTIAGNVSEDGLSGFRPFQVHGAATYRPPQSPSSPARGTTAQSGTVIGWVALAIMLGLLYFWVGSDAKDDSRVTTEIPATTNPKNTEVQEHPSQPKEVAKPQDMPLVKTERKPVKKVANQKASRALEEVPKNTAAQPENFEQTEAEIQEATVDLDAIRKFKSKM